MQEPPETSNGQCTAKIWKLTLRLTEMRMRKRGKDETEQWEVTEIN